jgi:photosystem II stability/assembly factor-like uncharacterized protein
METRFGVYLFSLSLLFSLISLHGQDIAWQWQNPLPQGNTINDLKLLSDYTLVAVANRGTVMLSKDGGSQWEISHEVAGITSDLIRLSFPNNEVGFAIAREYVIKSVDGGKTWNIIYNAPGIWLNDLSFTSTFHGWVVGDDGLILRTTNGGDTWTDLSWSNSRQLSSVYFQTELNGLIGAVGVIFSTSDGGSSWTETTPIFYNTFERIDFVDNLIGYSSGWNGLYKTSNGGNNWSRCPLWISQAYSSQYKDFHFINGDLGWMVGSQEVVDHTQDGGQTMIQQRGGIHPTYTLNAVEFTDSKTGWAAGTRGRIIYTTTGGNNWEYLSHGPVNDLYAIQFSDTLNGYAAGPGVFLITSTGGKIWEQRNAPSNYIIGAIYVIDKNNIIAIAEDGNIYHSSNVGGSWNIVYWGFSERGLSDMCFTMNGTGIAVGYEGTILRTTNWGYTWYSVNSGVAEWLLGCHVIDDTRAWAVGLGVMLKTDDAGLTWQSTYQSIDGATDVFFLDEQRGWVVGFTFPPGYGFIGRTMDGGEKWDFQYFADQLLDKISVLDSGKGVTVGRDGTILNTSDFGETWQAINSPSNTRLRDLFLSPTGKLWIVGDGGSIIFTSDERFVTSVRNDSHSISITEKSAEIYPNPILSNTMTIRFRMIQTDAVRLRIYDVIGRQIAFVEEYRLPGLQEFRVSLQDTPIGIYFYRLEVGKNLYTGKFVMMR